MFQPEVHEYATPFSGNAEAAFDLTRTALVSQGFEIVSDSDSELRVLGPGMHSNRQSAILGATEVWLRADSCGSEAEPSASLARIRFRVTHLASPF